MHLLEELRRERLMPILRTSSAAWAAELGHALIDGGYRVLEVSMTTPEATTAISRLVRDHPDVLIGAGTVLRPEQVSMATDAGATFVVTPALSASIDSAVAAGIPVLAGGLTPSEIVAAMERGATAAKLFPAEFGGPPYLSALRAPLPDVPFIPVGGVTVDSGRDYLARGAVALGLGSPLTGGVESPADFALLAERADAFRRMARAS